VGHHQVEDSEVIDFLKLWSRALRIDQWTKNGVVMLAWFFSVADSSQRDIVRGWESFLMAFAMAASFSFVSSAFYLLNDVADYESDRMHPVKRNRPIAAGLIHRFTAVRVSLVCFALGSFYPAMVVMFSPRRTPAYATIIAYVVMQCLYTAFLKRVPYLDVATLAAGFVLRAIAGAAIITAYISPWLLVCTFTLSLFLALCKRRHEMAVAMASRAALKGYHPRVLDALIVLSALGALGIYTRYTLAADTVARFGTRGLAFTAVFVALGLVRYMVLLYAKEDVGRPERVLLTDRLLWLILAGYGLAAFGAMALRGGAPS
jgi:4-hydroxybenzoate polyprenyltransferase